MTIKPRWKQGWPTKPGLYLVLLACGDHIGLTVERSTMEHDGEIEIPCLEARDTMDGVCFVPDYPQPLDEYWGIAESHYGPIPKRRQRKATP